MAKNPKEPIVQEFEPPDYYPKDKENEPFSDPRPIFTGGTIVLPEARS